MRKNYIGICLDKSGSMNTLRRPTVKAYNDAISVIRDASLREGQDTIMFSNAFGGTVSWLFRNSSVSVLKPLNEHDYRPDGGTPLFNALYEMIQELKKVPDYNDPNVAFQITVISDGEENTSSQFNKSECRRLLRELQATDRWTFSFMLPRGYARAFCQQWEVPSGNVMEWDSETERGTYEGFNTTSTAYDGYFTMRSKGLTSTRSFYTDLKGVKSVDLKKKCVDIKDQIDLFKNGNEVKFIREFCEQKTKKPFLKGAAFYELVKPEKEVQDYKQIAIRDRVSGAVFAGEGARQMLGLPAYGTVKLVPGDHSQYDVFVQSTSVNRKLPPNTRVLYWSKVGVPYIEGASSPWSR